MQTQNQDQQLKKRDAAVNPAVNPAASGQALQEALPSFQQLAAERKKRDFLQRTLVPQLALLASLPALILVWTLLGRQVPHVVLMMLAGALFAAGAVASAARLRQQASRRRNGAFPFLCPACLELGEALYTCPECQQPVRVWSPEEKRGSAWAMLFGCQRCAARVSSPEDAQARGLVCHCRECAEARYQQVAVAFPRVIGVPDSRAFDRACRELGLEPQAARTGRFAIQEGEAQPLCLLDLEQLEPGPSYRREHHPALGMEALWLAADSDALTVARALDGVERFWKQQGRPLRQVSVLVEAATLPPELQGRLARALGSVTTRVRLR